MESEKTPREVTLKPKAPPVALLQAAMVARQVVPYGAGHVTLFEDKIRVRDTSGEADALPRRYTLTHDDHTAELSLSIGESFDQEALDRPRVQRMRDEVLAELTGGEQPRLHVTCTVAGEELSGRSADPALRRRIFEREMPFALAVLRYGDRFFFERHPEWDAAPITVEFRSNEPRFAGEQEYGRVTDYRVTHIAGESRRLLVGAAALAAVGIGALVMGRMRK